MRTKFILITALLFLVHSISTYYIGLRIWQSIGVAVASELESYYWVIFIFLSGTYFLGRIGAIYFPSNFSDKMIWSGCYWLGLSFYLCLLWLGYDLVRLSNRLFAYLPEMFNQYPLEIGLSIVTVSIVLVIYGAWNASRPILRHYDITINKKVDDYTQLHIVVISDLHLGLLVGKKKLAKAIEIINRLKPDLVLMPGDILDENIGAFVENEMPDMLRGIRSRLGVFGILGSHEYIYGHSDKAIRYLEQAGITLLRDRYIRIGNHIQLVGRDDLLKKDLVGTPRSRLSTILQGCNRKDPIILMDHQPVDLEEAELQGVDLQLSGHTHHGQLFPINLVTQKLFTIDWGYLRKKQYQIIVSSGYGTWGPPIRLGTVSEIVDIRIKFAP
ncbi:metallophosphoesterase [Pelosinus sp. sgz500959]|uniref:metallophosphoesterase n=1 Tax=Pelosinus sp. sgz500959 TaxID=3242472 RepID=UPI00367360B2